MSWKFLSSAITSGFFLISGFALGQGDASDTYLREDPNYKPPESEPLYEQSGKRGEKLEVPNYLRVGGVFRIGSSKTPGSNYGVTKLYGGQVMYVAGLTSWTRVEIGVEALTGETGDTDATITVPYLILGRAGYGYSISKNLYGTFAFGLGSAKGSFDGKISGEMVKSDEDMTGLAVDLGYSLGARLGRFLEIYGGISYSFIEYSLDSTVGDVFDDKKAISVQIPNGQIGFSFYF